MQDISKTTDHSPKNTDQNSDLATINRKKRLNKRRENRDTTTPTKDEKTGDKVDGSDNEENTQDRKKKRLVRNREAAQASRERKKNMINELQQQVTQQKVLIDQLTQKSYRKSIHSPCSMVLEAENKVLKEKVKM